MFDHGAPESYTLDTLLFERPGGKEIQLDLFLDYASNLKLVELLDTGHFALETHVDEIAAADHGKFRRERTR